jgi:hypothetical protein
VTACGAGSPAFPERRAGRRRRRSTPGWTSRSRAAPPPRIARRLRRRGYALAADPDGFIVRTWPDRCGPRSATGHGRGEPRSSSACPRPPGAENEAAVFMSGHADVALAARPTAPRASLPALMLAISGSDLLCLGLRGGGCGTYRAAARPHFGSRLVSVVARAADVHRLGDGDRGRRLPGVPRPTHRHRARPGRAQPLGARLRRARAGPSVALRRVGRRRPGDAGCWGTVGRGRLAGEGQ